MNVNRIAVSVLCLAYNHEKYIRETLEAFVSQKTDFAFEVLVHDDASTDGTAGIIQEYAERYPDIIRPVFQKENQHSQGIPIWATHVNHLIRGRYVALCEGDDFWTDTLKLQRQFDVMEKHQECAMCVHRIQHVKETGERLDTFRPAREMMEGKLNTGDFLKIRMQYPFHTSSFFMRTALWLDFTNNPPEYRKAAAVGDEPMLLYMVTQGEIYYLPVCMSCYRLFSIGSWSSQYKRNPEKILLQAEKTYNMMRLYDEYTGHQYDCSLDLLWGKVLWLRGEYRELLKLDQRRYMRQCDWKRRGYIYLCAMIPAIDRIRKMKQKSKVKHS